MKQRSHNKLILTLAALAFGCVRGPAFLKQGGAPEASIHRLQVATVDQNGATSGVIAGGSKSTQVISASTNSTVAGSNIEFPPGSLAISTEVTIQAGSNLATKSVLSQLNVTSEVASSATSVAFTSSVATDAVVPFTVAIPLPDTSSLALLDPFANLIIIYHVTKASSSNADFTGIISRDAIDTSTGFARFAVSHFGTYQAVITKTLVQAVEIAAAPIVKAKKVIPPGVITDRFYFSRGPMPASFGGDAAQNIGHFKGWVHAFGPSKVGTQSTLSTGKISKALPDTP